MPRHFEFRAGAIREARLRQYGRCAVCGDDLEWVEEHGHHVVPNQSGRASNAADTFLRSTENCVVLFTVCHWAVHDGGRYQCGAVAPPDYYEYSHGPNGGKDRLAWIAKVNADLERIFGS
jgi:hypothetical protein